MSVKSPKASLFRKVQYAFDGKKTYLAALAIAVVVFLQQANIITDDVAQTLYGLLGAGGLAFLRAGINKV